MRLSGRNAAALSFAGILGLNSPAAAQTIDRSVPPPLGPTPSFTIPRIEHLTLSNGLPVLLMEKHQVPLVQVNLLVEAGSVMDPPGKSGLSSMVAAMMMEGAGSRSSLELADAIDDLGARITSTSGLHAMAVRLHTPRAQWDSALALFEDIALRPTFPPEELARKRDERLTALLEWRTEPGILDAILFNRVLYGEDHPYGRVAIGDEKALNSFSREDCSRFYETWFRPNYSTLIVVGDVDSAFLYQELERTFGAWVGGTAPRASVRSAHQVRGRRIFLVDKPGAPQTEIRIGRIGAARSTPDFFPLIVMNTILGGSFTSRLNTNLREEHGYTYSAGSYFDFRPLPGPFVATAAVQTAVTAKALQEFLKELRAIRQPPTEEELKRAKNYLSLSYPGEFQSVRQIAGQLEELVSYHLPDSYVNTYIFHIQIVTREDVARVAREWIDPENLVIVLVGDRKVIEGPVEALHLGHLQIRTVDEVLGKPPAVKAKTNS
jgi:zinc protease